MKRYLIPALLLIVFVLAGCVSTKAVLTSGDKAAIDVVANTWIDSLKSEDIERFLSTYWKDMAHTTFEADGSRKNYTLDEIRVEQQRLFDENDLFADLEYPEPEKDFTSEPGQPIYTYTVTFGDFKFQDIFQFLKRDGEWKIIQHIFRVVP
jgi:hypothetical protein